MGDGRVPVPVWGYGTGTQISVKNHRKPMLLFLRFAMLTLHLANNPRMRRLHVGNFHDFFIRKVFLIHSFGPIFLYLGLIGQMK